MIYNVGVRSKVTGTYMTEHPTQLQGTANQLINTRRGRRREEKSCIIVSFKRVHQKFTWIINK